jgi:Ca-activated chloride channel family protein
MSRLRRVLWPVLASVLCLVLGGACAAFAVQELYGVPLTERSMRFERPAALVLCAAAVLVLLARGFAYRQRSPRLRVSRGHDFAVLSAGPRVWLGAVGTGLRVAAVALLVLALMGPQSIHARNATEVEGIDIVLTLDLSDSMQAADIKPTRFEATKQVVSDFIRRRPNDRLGAVVFGRDAYTLLPLTTDHEALRTLVSELELGLIDGRGTAIGNGLGTALNRLRKSTAKSKVVILATDGQSNSGNVSPTQAAEFARALGVKVYTILMGYSGDAPVQTGHDLFGRPIFDRGNFPVNPELLKEVATQTGGAAFQASDRSALEKSFHTILDQLERSQIEDAGRVYGELFPAFVWPAFALLLLELLLVTLVLRRWP